MTTATAPAVPPASSPDPAPPTPVARRVLWASLVGTSLESYDFYIFSYTSALFLGPLFYTPLGPVGATLASLLNIGVGFIIRPLGAIVFGHLGDRIGRRRTLLVTILIMGVATGLIGLLPTYAMAGWLGGVLLTLLRLIQGFSLGGEWAGAVLLASEHAGQKRHAFYAAVPQLGSPIGSLASAFVLLAFLSGGGGPLALDGWAWRIPFLIAIPFLLVSLYLRWSIDETPVFGALTQKHERSRIPVLDTFRRAPLAVLLGVAVALLGIGSYSLMNTYTVSYGVTHLGFSYNDLLVATSIGGLLQLITIPLFGAWANRIGSAKVVAWGAVGTLIIAFPMYFLLQFATFPILVGTMIIGGILPTASWAALGGLMGDLFPGRFRYSAMSIAYAIAAVISGFVPALTDVLGHATGLAWWHPGIVLAIMALVTAVAAFASVRRSRPVDTL